MIESYPDDKPFASDLRVAKVDGRYLHVVTARDGETVHVITAYEPDPAKWSDGFTIRIKAQ